MDPKPKTKSLASAFKESYQKYKSIKSSELETNILSQKDFLHFKKNVYPEIQSKGKEALDAWRLRNAAAAHPPTSTQPISAPAPVVRPSGKFAASYPVSLDEEGDEDDDHKKDPSGAFDRLLETEDGDDINDLKIAVDGFKSFEATLMKEAEEIQNSQKQLKTLINDFKKKIDTRQQCCAELFRKIDIISDQMIANKKARHEEED